MILFGHLGLGDHIICNGLVRTLAPHHDRIVIPCYEHNRISVASMFHDLHNVEAVGFENERAILNGLQSLKEALGTTILPLGFYGTSFDRNHFDREFYRQAHLDFELRWEAFGVPDWLHDPVTPPPGEFCLVHHDPERGFRLNPSKLPNMLTVHVTHDGGPIVNWLPAIQNARELHLINSSVLNLADSVRLPEAQKRFVHAYVRESSLPTLRNHWNIIRSS